MALPGRGVDVGDAVQLPQEVRLQLFGGTAYPAGGVAIVAALHAVRAQDARFKT